LDAFTKGFGERLGIETKEVERGELIENIINSIAKQGDGKERVEGVKEPVADEELREAKDCLMKQLREALKDVDGQTRENNKQTRENMIKTLREKGKSPMGDGGNGIGA
jgi:hypothetical protein